MEAKILKGHLNFALCANRLCRRWTIFYRRSSDPSRGMKTVSSSRFGRSAAWFSTPTTLGPRVRVYSTTKPLTAAALKEAEGYRRELPK